MTITILKYVAFACQIGVFACGLGLFIWHMVRIVRGFKNV